MGGWNRVCVCVRVWVLSIQIANVGKKLNKIVWRKKFMYIPLIIYQRIDRDKFCVCCEWVRERKISLSHFLLRLSYTFFFVLFMHGSLKFCFHLPLEYQIFFFVLCQRVLFSLVGHGVFAPRLFISTLKPMIFVTATQFPYTYYM